MKGNGWLVFGIVVFSGWVVLTVFHDIPYEVLGTPQLRPIIDASGYLIFVALVLVIMFVFLARFRVRR